MRALTMAARSSGWTAASRALRRAATRRAKGVAGPPPFPLAKGPRPSRPEGAGLVGAVAWDSLGAVAADMGVLQELVSATLVRREGLQIQRPRLTVPRALGGGQLEGVARPSRRRSKCAAPPLVV